MDECSHCGASFEDEEAYLQHLRDEHENELGRIDRQRVDQLEPEGPSRRALLAAVGALGAVIAGIGYTTFSGDGSSPTDDVDQALLEDVETFDDLGRQHVSSDPDYDHYPPTSGPHYDDWVTPGFYEEPQQYGELVHNLEHGHVVVYYDADEMTDDVEEGLRDLVTANDHSFAAVVVVPHPDDDPDATYTLTVWTKRLRMDDYDPEVVQAFVDAYVGRGPENPINGPPLGDSS